MVYIPDIYIYIYIYPRCAHPTDKTVDEFRMQPNSGTHRMHSPVAAQTVIVEHEALEVRAARVQLCDHGFTSESRGKSKIDIVSKVSK